jgi:hypothetical protein
MNAPRNTDCDRETLVETFATSVTEATYPIALEFGVSGSSLVDLEVEIWKTVTEVVRNRGTDLLRSPGANRIGGMQCS